MEVALRWARVPSPRSQGPVTESTSLPPQGFVRHAPGLDGVPPALERVDQGP